MEGINPEFLYYHNQQRISSASASDHLILFSGKFCLFKMNEGKKQQYETKHMEKNKPMTK